VEFVAELENEEERDSACSFSVAIEADVVVVVAGSTVVDVATDSVTDTTLTFGGSVLVIASASLEGTVK
jgi:hypothetical protein